MSGAGLVWKFPHKFSHKATPFPGSQPRHLRLGTAVGTQGLQTAFYPPRLLQFPQRFGYRAEIKLCSKRGKQRERTGRSPACCAWPRALMAGRRGPCSAPWRPPPRESRETRRAARAGRGRRWAGRRHLVPVPGPARAEGAPATAPAATAGRGMDTHYYGGEQSGTGAGQRILRRERRARRGSGGQRRGLGLEGSPAVIGATVRCPGSAAVAARRVWVVSAFPAVSGGVCSDSPVSLPR